MYQKMNLMVNKLWLEKQFKANPSKSTKTGINYITVGIAICILSISGILFYRKYNDIKFIK